MSSVVFGQTFISRKRIHKSFLGFVKALLVPVYQSLASYSVFNQLDSFFCRIFFLLTGKGGGGGGG